MLEVSHVALGARHVALGLQRDMAAAEHPLLARKRAKRRLPRRVGGRHVALGLQRDMAASSHPLLARKRAKSHPPRRIGSEPCRIGLPTRHGCGRLPSFSLEKGEKTPAMSCWWSATSHWTSNATWLRQDTLFSLEKGQKSARHVALGRSHVVLGFQRDVAKAARPLLAQTRAKKHLVSYEPFHR